MKHLTRTIDVTTFSLGDWLLVAKSCRYNAYWAIDNWTQNAAIETLITLTKKEREEIANNLKCDHPLDTLETAIVVRLDDENLLDKNRSIDSELEDALNTMKKI